MQQGLPDSYTTKNLGTHYLVCHVDPDSDPEMQWKICLTEKTMRPTIFWFHQVLNHPGQEKTVCHHSTEIFSSTITSLGQRICLWCLPEIHIDGAGYGLLAAQGVHLAPWTEVAVDLMGPWTIVVGNTEYKFNVLPSINTTINSVELIRIDEKTASRV